MYPPPPTPPPPCKAPQTVNHQPLHTVSIRRNCIPYNIEMISSKEQALSKPVLSGFSPTGRIDQTEQLGSRIIYIYKAPLIVFSILNTTCVSVGQQDWLWKTLSSVTTDLTDSLGRFDVVPGRREHATFVPDIIEAVRATRRELGHLPLSRAASTDIRHYQK